MTTYSPFDDKPIRNLEAPDLIVLKTVHEGWHVEYKSSLVAPAALAKAISAFANTYGGWLFLGIGEASKQDAVAGSFPGLSNEELDVTLQRARQCAAEYLNPTPHFETRTLRGPCCEIGLAAESSIVVLQVPKSHTAPHIHKDGRIYRRVADSSEPKPENDRFTLDQLWRRGDHIRDYTREWIEDDPEFSKGEKEMPYVRILLSADPWRQRDLWIDASPSKIRTILTSESVPLDTFYTTADGFIARQAKNNNPHNFVLTWKIRRDLECEIIIPLPRYDSVSVEELAVELDGYKHAERLLKILQAQSYREPRIADLNFLMSLMVDFVAKYRRLLRLAEAGGDFHFKVRMLNVWRVLPFVDIDAVLNEYEKYGLPIAMDSVVMYPPGRGPDSFQFLELKNFPFEELEEADAGLVQALLMFTRTAVALGVPALVEADDTSKSKIVSRTDLLAASERATEVQRRRNIRNARYM